MDAGLWFLDFANDKFLLLNWYHLEVPDNESGELYLADHIKCHFTHLYIDFLSTKRKVFQIFCVEYIILVMVSLKSIIWTSSWLMSVSMSSYIVMNAELVMQERWHEKECVERNYSKFV